MRNMTYSEHGLIQTNATHVKKKSSKGTIDSALREVGEIGSP